jgi:hypothetical protein
MPDKSPRRRSAKTPAAKSLKEKRASKKDQKQRRGTTSALDLDAH